MIDLYDLPRLELEANLERASFYYLPADRLFSKCPDDRADALL
jgi:hypothetical protein